MRSSGGKRNAGVYRSTRPLIDERIVSKNLHGADRSGEARGDGSGHLYGRSDGGVVVGSGDSNSAGAGKGGSQIIWRSMPVLEEGHGAGRKDQEDAENDILDKAALRARNSGKDHRRIRTNTPLASLKKEAGYYLGACLRERVINRD